MREMYELWWDEIPNARKIIDEIVKKVLYERKSIIIKCSIHIPWPDELEYIVKENITENSPEASLVSMDDEDIDPGKLLCDRFCTEEQMINFRHRKGYAVFLAEAADIMLNSSIVYFGNIVDGRVEDWVNFVSAYNKALGSNRGGHFILETTKIPKNCNLKGIEIIDIDKMISDYDYFIFNMLVASAINESKDIKLYASELAVTICGHNLELSTYCLSKNNYSKFLVNPEALISKFYAGEEMPDDYDKRKVNHDIWTAQVRRIFPLLEEYRQHIVTKYRDALSSLPLRDAQGNDIADPNDIELGVLSFALWNGWFVATDEEVKIINLFKEARNILAHINVLPYGTVKEIFNITI